MTLTELVSLINRSKKLIIPLGLIILLAAGVYLLRLRSLPGEKIPAPNLGGDLPPLSVQLKGEFKLPRWGDVYRVVGDDSPLTENRAAEVGRKFGLTSAPQVLNSGGGETTFIWNDPPKSLSLGRQGSRNYLRYGLDLLSKPALAGKGKGEVLPTELQTVETVRQFLVGKGLTFVSQLTPLESSWVAVRGHLWADVDGETKADALRLIMIEKLEEIPIFIPGNERLGSLVAYMGREGKILKLDCSWSEGDYELFDRYPLQGFQDSLRVGRVVEVVGEGVTEAPTELQALSITSASFGYFADPSSGFIYPVFVSKGESEGQEGKLLQVTVLTPAISSKWLE